MKIKVKEDKMKGKKSMTFKIPAALHESLHLAAYREGTTMTAIILKFLSGGLKNSLTKVAVGDITETHTGAETEI